MSGPSSTEWCSTLKSQGRRCGRAWPRLTFTILSALLLIALPASIALSQDTETVAATTKASVGVLLVERTDGIASGTVFMAADRLVLTANHVVVGARRMLLKFPDYPPVEPIVSRTDAEADIAVLTIPGLPVRPLPLGDVAQVREGQRIVVISYPRVEALGTQTPTVTEGIISASRPNVLQIQAPISPGSSGGPVLNLRGEVVGIVRATLRGEQQGINFATAVNAAKPILGAAVLALSTPGQAQPVPVPVIPSPVAPEPFLILPGQNIGPIKLGMSLESVTAMMGPPKGSQSQQGGNVVYRWYTASDPKGIGILTKPTREVTQVWVLNDPRFATREGLRVGSTMSEIRAIFGPGGYRESDGKDTRIVFDSMGIFFTVNLDANSYNTSYVRVYQVDIRKPRL